MIIKVIINLVVENVLKIVFVGGDEQHNAKA